jgi:hypothetical protein
LFKEDTLPELVEERMHQCEQGGQYLSTRSDDAEQEGGHNEHALKVAYFKKSASTTLPTLE